MISVPLGLPESTITVSAVTVPAIPKEYEGTRAALHAYARVAGAVARANGIAHPKWWHVSLAVRPEGLVTDPIPLPDGGALSIGIDPTVHELVVRTSTGVIHRVDLSGGPSGTLVGDEVVGVIATLGLDGVERDRYADADGHDYDARAAATYFSAFTTLTAHFERHRLSLGDRVGPVQLWPHGFDLATEWFGTVTTEYEGESQPAQINLGFVPAHEPYLYSSPWPFDEALIDVPLPHGAVWNTDGWQGARLPYDALRDGDAGRVISDFARAVFDAASPGMIAGH